MTASFAGYDDIARVLIEAKAHVNTHDEVHVLTLTTKKYAALLGITLSSTI